MNNAGREERGGNGFIVRARLCFARARRYETIRVLDGMMPEFKLYEGKGGKAGNGRGDDCFLLPKLRNDLFTKLLRRKWESKAKQRERENNYLGVVFSFIGICNLFFFFFFGVQTNFHGHG